MRFWPMPNGWQWRARSDRPSNRWLARSSLWKALREAYGKTREQRCWVHKTGNVLNKLPKGLQKKAKQHVQDIWMAETRKDAESAFDFFLEAYGPKYPKATACLAKDRDVLLTFYDFPAEHWKHIRTTVNVYVDGLQTVPVRPEKMAKTRWIKSARRDHSRRQIRRWRMPGSRRRTISPYTTFDNSSSKEG